MGVLMEGILILVFGSYLVPGSIETMSETYRGEAAICEVKIGNNGRYLAGKTLEFEGHTCNEVTREYERMITSYSRGEFEVAQGYAGLE